MIAVYKHLRQSTRMRRSTALRLAFIARRESQEVLCPACGEGYRATWTHPHHDCNAY